MRAANITTALILVAGLAAPADAQLHDHNYGFGHDHGYRFGGSRAFNPYDLPYGGVYGTGSPYPYAYSPFPGYYGYGAGYGYGFEGFSAFGPGLSRYRGPAYYGPAITPPVYAYPPLGYGNGFGYGYGYGPTFGYGTAWAPVGPDPLNNQLLRYQYDQDWTRLSARLADLALRNTGDPAPGTGAVPVPSTPEAKIKSLRFQAQGDESFLKQDYGRALDRYKAAASAAKDNGDAYFRTGYALVALGRFSSALEYFKRGLTVEPALAVTGPAPDELYGDNQLAWNAHLGRATRWVREDVRDAQRVLLLGILLYFDGDTRAREFLETAWQLSGGTEPVVARLLNPPEIEGVKVVEPAPAGDAAPAAPAEPTEKGPDLGTAPPASGTAPSERPDLDLPDLPQPPAPAPRSDRPSGQEPLFPLPSEQGNSPEAADAPPLPAPATD